MDISIYPYVEYVEYIEYINISIFRHIENNAKKMRNAVPVRLVRVARPHLSRRPKSGPKTLSKQNWIRPQTFVFLRKIKGFYTTATPRQTPWHPGKDNLAPAEDLLNKNPSLVALGNDLYKVLAGVCIKFRDGYLRYVCGL